MEGHPQNLDALRKQQESLLNEIGLIAGMPVTLVKVVEENPELPQSKTVQGHLDRFGQFGYAISVNEGESTTPPLTQIDIQDNRTYLHCGTSIYELVSRDSQEPAPESAEKRKPKSITTAKGSVYTYLPDGRTQRYKKATETLEAPQDLLVFIPPWDTIATKAKELYPSIFQGIENSTQFEQLLLEYMSKDSSKTIRPGVGSQEVYSLGDVPHEAEVFLHFIDKISKQTDFSLPTSREPKIGYTTFDARKFYDETDGTYKRERHIGNKIVAIEYE